jgi:hypothetical protein
MCCDMMSLHSPDTISPRRDGPTGGFEKAAELSIALAVCDERLLPERTQGSDGRRFFFACRPEWGAAVAKKGDLKTVLKMNVGLDAVLAQALDASAERNERTYNQEVRYALRKFYGIDRTPAEDTAGVSA